MELYLAFVSKLRLLKINIKNKMTIQNMLLRDSKTVQLQAKHGNRIDHD